VAEVVRPRVPPLAIVAAVVAVVLYVAGFVRLGAPYGLIAIAIAVGAGLWAAQLLLDRGRVRAIRFEVDGGVALVSAQIEHTLSRARVGAIGFSGSVVAGRLSMPPFRVFDPMSIGRVVVLDHAGDLTLAMRAGWIAIDELSAAASRAGLAWAGALPLGEVTLAVPAAPVESGGVAEGSARALRQMKRDCRSLLRISTAVLAGLIATVALGSAARIPEGVVDPIEVVLWIGVFLWILLVGTERLRSRPARVAGKLIQDATWSLVDGVVLRGAPVDPGVRIVVVVDPATGRPGVSWLVEPSVTARWLQEFQRGRFHLTVGADGDAAVLASGDWTHLAVLVRRSGWAKSPELHAWAQAHLTDQWGVRSDRPPTH
jgi:hypothetical protein